MAFTIDLDDQVAMETTSANFTCKLNVEDVPLQWFVNGEEIPTKSDKFRRSKDGTTHTLTVCKLTLDDATKVTAKCKDVETSATLTVEGMSKLIWLKSI